MRTLRNLLLISLLSLNIAQSADHSFITNKFIPALKGEISKLGQIVKSIEVLGSNHRGGLAYELELKVNFEQGGSVIFKTMIYGPGNQMTASEWLAPNMRGLGRALEVKNDSLSDAKQLDLEVEGLKRSLNNLKGEQARIKFFQPGTGLYVREVMARQAQNLKISATRIQNLWSEYTGTPLNFSPDKALKSDLGLAETLARYGELLMRVGIAQSIHEEGPLDSSKIEVWRRSGQTLHHIKGELILVIQILKGMMATNQILEKGGQYEGEVKLIGDHLRLMDLCLETLDKAQERLTMIQRSGYTFERGQNYRAQMVLIGTPYSELKVSGGRIPFQVGILALSTQVHDSQVKLAGMEAKTVSHSNVAYSLAIQKMYLNEGMLRLVQEQLKQERIRIKGLQDQGKIIFSEATRFLSVLDLEAKAVQEVLVKAEQLRMEAVLKIPGKR